MMLRQLPREEPVTVTETAKPKPKPTQTEEEDRCWFPGNDDPIVGY